MKHKLLIGGYGNGADYVTAAFCDDGSLGVAYVPSPRTLKMDLSQMTGPITAQWFDPAGGRFIKASDSSLENEGSHDFTPPGRNADGDEDWVLLLHA